jgi:hypothetical protein
LLREEWVESSTADSVQSVTSGSKAGARNLKLIEVEDGFVARLVLRVELFIVVRLVDVKLVWTDSNNAT